MPQGRKVGLARALSKMGHCSRSAAVDLIRAGRVRLNSRAVRDPQFPTRLPQDRITVDGSPVQSHAKVYLAMSKPRGIVTTAFDEKGRATVYDLLAPDAPWIGPVGRLDKASEGLLLLTNDSEWAARVSDPTTHLDKCYHVQVDCLPGAELLARLGQGVELEGEQLSVKSARVLRSGKKNSWLEIVLDEGRNRQIRRLLDALGVSVLRLVRVSIGPLKLGDLGKGQTRRLDPAEKLALDRAMDGAGKKRAQKHNGRMPIDVG